MAHRPGTPQFNFGHQSIAAKWGSARVDKDAYDSYLRMCERLGVRAGSERLYTGVVGTIRSGSVQGPSSHYSYSAAQIREDS